MSMVLESPLHAPQVTPRARPRALAEPLTVLDLGSHTLRCVIAAAQQDGRYRPLAMQLGAAQGLHTGDVTASRAAAHAVRTVLSRAEAEAGLTVRRVHVSMSAGAPRAVLRTAAMAIPGVVGAGDVERLLRFIAERCARNHHTVLRVEPIGVVVDGVRVHGEVVGRLGQRLGVYAHVTLCRAEPLRRLLRVVEAAHVDVVDVDVAGRAASGCLTDDERQHGAVLLDIGADMTGITVHHAGRLRHFTALPQGAANWTRDLALRLGTDTASAEQLKIRFGDLCPLPSDEHLTVRVPRLGAPHDHDIVPRAEIGRQLHEPVEALLCEVQRALLRAPHLPPLRNTTALVLTGGGSRLHGITALAHKMFEMPARLGDLPPFAGQRPNRDVHEYYHAAAGWLRGGTVADGALSYRALHQGRGVPARLATLRRWLVEAVH